jgi:micrococcal nuclease
VRALLILSFLISGPVAAQDIAACAGLSEGPRATISQVIDGETVRLHDGRELRLAGILAPRPEDAGTGAGKWPSAVAARAELEALALGGEVTLAFGAVREDRYGRHIGHGFVAVRGSQENRIWLQGHLVGQGLARVMTTAQNRSCAKELLDLERKARDSARGIWAEEAYKVRTAGAPDALLALRGTFQIVTGEIAKAEASRSLIRLEFTAPERRPPVRGLIARPRAAPGAEKAGGRGDRTGDLTGKQVLLRGYVEERGGAPFLDLTVAGDVEVLEDASEEDAQKSPRRGVRGPSEGSKSGRR